MYNNRLNKPVNRVKSLITYTLLSVVKITHLTDVKHQHFLAGDWTVTVCVVVESKSKEWRSFFLFPPEDNKGTVTRSLRLALELDFGLAAKNIYITTYNIIWTEQIKDLFAYLLQFRNKSNVKRCTLLSVIDTNHSTLILKSLWNPLLFRLSPPFTPCCCIDIYPVFSHCLAKALCSVWVFWWNTAYSAIPSSPSNLWAS